MEAKQPGRPDTPILPYPSLAKWIYSLEAKLDGVLACYVGSNHMQSTLFPHGVKSLPYALGRYAQHPEVFVDQVQGDLKAMLTSYFKFAEVKVSHKPLPENEHFHEVFLEIEVGDGDAGKHKQQSIVFAEDSVVRRVTHFTSTGEVRYVRNYETNQYR